MAHRPSICTMSLGRAFAGHDLAHKLDMARKYGFEGIELFFEDLVHLAKTISGKDSTTRLLAAATSFRQMCDVRGLEIICVQPFMHYEGLLDRKHHKVRVDEMRQVWMPVAHILGTDLIVIPSTFLPEDQVTDDLSLIVEDMAEVADIGLRESPVIRIAYEALCWGTRVDTWEKSWDIVQRVDRPNFGICLDAFNIAGRIFADPASKTARTPNCERDMSQSMENLLSLITDPSRVFLLQVADAEQLVQPIAHGHPFYDAQQPSRMSWSRNARLFYGEGHLGGYLPVRQVLDTIVNGLGLKGWLSFEIFNRRLAEEDPSVPEEMASRASQSWARMKRDLSLQVDEGRPLGRMQAML